MATELKKKSKQNWETRTNQPMGSRAKVVTRTPIPIQTLFCCSPRRPIAFSIRSFLGRRDLVAASKRACRLPRRRRDPSRRIASYQFLHGQGKHGALGAPLACSRPCPCHPGPVDERRSPPPYDHLLVVYKRACWWCLGNGGHRWSPRLTRWSWREKER